MKAISMLALALVGCMDEQSALDAEGMGVDASVKSTVGEICDGEDNDADGMVDEDCGQCDLLVTRSRLTWAAMSSCVFTGGATGDSLLPITRGTTSLSTVMQVRTALSAAASTTTARLGRELVAARLNEKAFFLTDLPYDDRDGDGANETVGEILDLADAAYTSGTMATRMQYLTLVTALNMDGVTFPLWFSATCATEPEVCNWVDDDMDGTIDEDCACAEELPTFSGSVQPIFDDHCVGCHSGSMPPRGQDLSDGVSYDMIVNVAASELSSMDRIEPYDVDNSYLIHKVEGTQRDVGGSGVRMPQGGPYLDDMTVDVIKGWILAGCPDD